jgi:hypothetical protein
VTGRPSSPVYDGAFDRVSAWATANVQSLAVEYGRVALGPGGRGQCPLHGGTGPNFVARNGHGWHCHSQCAEGGDGIDLVRRLAFPDLDKKAGRIATIRELASRAGVTLDAQRPGPVYRPAPKVVPVVSAADIRRAARLAELEGMRTDGCVSSEPPVICAALLAELPLDPIGEAYLVSRGLEPARAHAAGFRSLPDAASWRALSASLADSFVAAERELAGLHRGPWGAAWERQPPALVIPYVRRGEVVALRFRNLAPTAEHKERYRDLVGVGALPCPFNADALEQLDGQEVHVVEGELNAWTLASYGLRAIGLPGAGRWRREWAPLLAPSARVVLWLDADEAGLKGRAHITETLRAAHGDAWVRARGCAYQLPVTDDGPLDANDLHRRGELHARIERAAWRA